MISDDEGQIAQEGSAGELGIDKSLAGYQDTSKQLIKIMVVQFSSCESTFQALIFCQKYNNNPSPSVTFVVIILTNSSLGDKGMHIIDLPKYPSPQQPLYIASNLMLIFTMKAIQTQINQFNVILISYEI